MTIEQRVAKLERQNRWMKRGGGLMLAAVACVVLMGQGKPKALPDLVVRSLTLRDGEGKPRAVLSMEKPNTPSLVLLDQNGTKRVYLLAEQGGRASLGLGPGDGRIRTYLRVSSGGDTVLGFLDKNGKSGSQFGIDLLGQPSLYLMTEGRLQVSLEATRNMARLLFSQPGQNRAQVSLGITSRGRVIWEGPPK